MARRVCVVDSFATGPGVVPTQGALLADCLERDGVTVIRTSARRGRLTRAADIARTLLTRRRDYDVALIQTFGRRGFDYARLASWLAAVAGKKVVLVLRGGTLAAEWRDAPARLRPALQRASALVAPSTHMARAFGDAGVPIVVISNFIELERYPFRLRAHVKPRMVWSRAFHDQYHPGMAIRAAAIVARAYPDMALTMIGPDRGERGASERLAAELGIARNVRFTGHLSKAVLIEETASHDIHLHTNRIDNMPVTLLENMALGLPIVATRVGGVPHMVTDGRNGLLVPDGDAEAMAAAIVRLLSEPGLAATLSAAGRTHVDACCSWNAVRQAWMSVIAS